MSTELSEAARDVLRLAARKWIMTARSKSYRDSTALSTDARNAVGTLVIYRRWMTEIYACASASDHGVQAELVALLDADREQRSRIVSMIVLAAAGAEASRTTAESYEFQS